MRLLGPQFDITPQDQRFEWSGRLNLASFDVDVQAEASAGPAMLTFQVSVADVPLAHIPKRLNIDARLRRDRQGPPFTRQEIPGTAFASCASSDAASVLPRLSTLHRFAPGLDIFVDCLDLTPGEKFKPRLACEIRRRDAFLLARRDAAWVSAGQR